MNHAREKVANLPDSEPTLNQRILKLAVFDCERKLRAIKILNPPLITASQRRKMLELEYYIGKFTRGLNGAS